MLAVVRGIIMAMVALLEIVIVESVCESGAVKTANVRAKYGKLKKWVINGIPEDVNININDEIHLYSADHAEGIVARDANMMSHIDMMEIFNMGNDGNVIGSQKLLRKSDGAYRKKTQKEIEQTDKMNTLATLGLVAAAQKREYN